MTDEPEHVTVRFLLDEGAPVESEGMWAVPVEGGYLIDNIPFWARGIAQDDVVEAEVGPDGGLWATGVLVDGGAATVQCQATARRRVRAEQDLRWLMTRLERLGIAYEGSGEGHQVSMHVVESDDVVALSSLLEEFADRGKGWAELAKQPGWWPEDAEER
ncbi:DUF4265 domain-containing protein [Brachybacterium hainanense]|uniref:DUF4265 domain-containing protein n=1 Tax=Brachybacterium hainanense TaxID=1541174 RepID=A0ABV6RI77_9MICO